MRKTHDWVINYLFDHPYNIWDFNLATESLRTTDDEYTAYIGIPVEFALQRLMRTNIRAHVCLLYTSSAAAVRVPPK